ncbi:MAG: hypothetical protein LBL13_02210 [Bacteroidales bacterium]|jgi:hypothetical protein|nr:hypothetical protein [Bacteroidales bacterium]
MEKYMRLQQKLYQEEISLHAVTAKKISGRNFATCGYSENYIRKKFRYIRLQQKLYQEEISLHAVAAKKISGRNFATCGYSEKDIRKIFSYMRLRQKLYQEKILCSPFQRNLYNIEIKIYKKMSKIINKNSNQINGIYTIQK